MIEALDCRFVAERTMEGFTLTTEVDTGEPNGGWAPTDAWLMEHSPDTPPTDDELTDQLEQRGWRLTGAVTHTDRTFSGRVQPSDWRVVVERATARLKEAERIHLARNGLIAAAPRAAISAIELGEAAELKRHRIYQIQGFGKNEPGFHF